MFVGFSLDGGSIAARWIFDESSIDLQQIFVGFPSEGGSIDFRLLFDRYSIDAR